MSLSLEASQMAVTEKPGVCLCTLCNGGVIGFSPAWAPSAQGLWLWDPPQYSPGRLCGERAMDPDR